MTSRFAPAVVALVTASALACGSETSGDTASDASDGAVVETSSDAGSDAEISSDTLDAVVVDTGCVAARSETGPPPLVCDGKSCPGDGYDWACCARADGGSACAPRFECAPTSACTSKSTCASDEVCCLHDGKSAGACGPAPCLGVRLCASDKDCTAPERCVDDGAHHVCASCP